MKMTTFGPLRGDSTDMKLQIEQAYKKFGERPQVAIVYPSIQCSILPIVETIKSVVDIPVVGATTGGAGFTERGLALNGFVGAFLGGRETEFQIEVIKDINGNEDKVTQVVSNIVSQASGGIGHSIFLLANANTFDGEKLSQIFSKNLPPHWRVFGGFAGDNFKFGDTKVFFDKQEFTNAIILTYINSKNIPGVGVRHGYSPILGVHPMQVTKADNNIIHEINHQSAVKAYCETLQKLGLLDDHRNVIHSLALYSIGVKTYLGEKWKIRSPLAIQGDSLVLAGSIPEGSNISIVNAANEDILFSAKEAVQTAFKNSGQREISAQLVISCANRQQRLGKEYIEEVKAFRSSSHTPMLGFTSYGEFARYGGLLEGFHNTTSVVSIW